MTRTQKPVEDVRGLTISARTHNQYLIIGHPG